MTYLMSTMTLGTLSICMTVVILNVHHRGATQRVPPWLRRAAFVYVARLLCVKTPYAHDCDDTSPAAQTSSTSSAAVNIEESPPPSPIEPIWKRRSDAKPPPSSPASKLPDLPRSCIRRDRLELTLLRMFRRSNERAAAAAAAVPTCNGCAFIADSSAMTAVPPRRRRSRTNAAAASQTRTGNGRVTASHDPPASSDATAVSRDEVLSPLLKTARLTSAATRRHSATARRLDLARHCRSDAAWSTLDSGCGGGSSTARCHDDDELETDMVERYANEWRELARILDRLCFWILLVLMTASGFIILLYPKYTGGESDWSVGIT